MHLFITQTGDRLMTQASAGLRHLCITGHAAEYRNLPGDPSETFLSLQAQVRHRHRTRPAYLFATLLTPFYIFR